MTERERMLAGQLYDCGDAELLTQWHKAKNLAREYNQLDSTNTAAKDRILTELLGGRGANLWITAPFYVDYGNNIYFGNNCEVNMNCTFLDDSRIVIGDNALIAPNVQIYTAFHPTTPLTGLGRRKKTGLSPSARPRQHRSSSATTSGLAAVPFFCREFISETMWSSVRGVWSRGTSPTTPWPAAIPAVLCGKTVEIGNRESPEFGLRALFIPVPPCTFAANS